MGLTLNYNLALDSASIDEAKTKVMTLRQLALHLPFARVEELVELGGDACKFDKEDVNDPYIFLKIRALKPIEIAINGFSAMDPTYFIGFDTYPGEGCETAAFGLATHGEVGEVNEWYWTGFCKTQYASNPEYGGIQNFVNCHLMLIRMLDEAQKLGILLKVNDGGKYWETRNLSELIGEVKASNILMATIMGQVRDRSNSSTAQIIAPIFDFPNFEYLEAEGNS